MVERACPECGFAAGSVEPDEIADQILALAAPWPEVLARPDVAERPSELVWSALEYGCHVRDVCRVMQGRLRLLLDRDDPTFPNWDQDAAAVQNRYQEQDPVEVAAELADAAATWSATYRGVGDDQWERAGLRSNGSEFTVTTLGRYGLHDLAHHLVDVGARRN